ncbi:MAG: hypothetical protein CVU95_03015 [Firmicutes bacterium HGW-Firmicutes-2]|jgi:hypothetical protein|nr:MAG: hypothetical protein CVU95_03015 [Firmicutes bacterium HGW-Firmicutes-2]
MNTLICPISKETANKAVVRLTGFLIATLIVLYALTSSVYIIIAILIDFIIRAFTTLKYSPLSWLSTQIAKVFHLKPITIDKAPKIFASRVGFLFSITALALYPLNPQISLVVLLVLMAFALLEAIFDFCVGCIVYTYVVLPLNKKSGSDTL